jgi:RNA polymerase subunit RPABC4/transcription elongation factor Spt4
MSRFPKPCIDCGRLTPPGQSRCITHQQRVDDLNTIRRAAIKKKTNQYGGKYQALSRIVREQTIVCAICGEGARYGDPFEADHIVPSTEVTDISQLQGVHRSCNQHKSNK